MFLLIFSALTIFLSTAKCQENPNPDLQPSWQLLDEYGETMVFSKTGGEFNFQCNDSKNCKDTDILKLLDPDGQTIRERPCTSSTEWAPVKVDENMKLGVYTCHHATTKQNRTYPFLYRTCETFLQFRSGTWAEPFVRLGADASKSCVDDQCAKPDHVCVVSHTKNVQQCVQMDVDLCMGRPASSIDYQLFHSMILCPVQTEGLCNATVTNYSGAWSYMSHDDRKCPKEQGVPRVIYDQQHRLFLQPILLKKAVKNIEIVYEENAQLDDSAINCTVKTRNRSIISAYPGKISKRFVVDLTAPSDLFALGPQTYKFSCVINVRNHSYWRVRTESILVVLEASAASIAATGDSVECKLDTPPPDNIRVAGIHWASKSDPSRKTNGPNIKAAQLGEYNCLVALQYKTCSPHAKVDQVTTFADFKGTTQLRTTTTTTPPASGSNIDHIRMFPALELAALLFCVRRDK